jgi:uncharacterized protein (DUF1778 family)
MPCRAKLDLRLSPEAKQKLQTAAESAGRTVSEFVLESAAMLRTLQAADIAGIRSLAVPAKDESASRFYEHFGFIPSPTDALHLFLLVKDIKRLAQHQAS